MSMLLNVGSPSCTASCVPSYAEWANATRALILSDGEHGKPTRRYSLGPAHFARTGRDNWGCPSLRESGVGCDQLPWDTRGVLGWLLAHLNYRGPSAEIGVWLGHFSSMVLRDWPQGGRHLAVDP